MPEIDGDRLLADLQRLRGFGTYETGVHRPTYSPIDMESRRWTVERMTEAGLDATLDGIGNVLGRSRAPGKKLLLGSHTETQPHAGWLDGALGVVYAIEIARAFRDDPSTRELGIDAVSFADEEGHFASFTGSRSFCGLLSEADIDAARNRYDGTPLRDALLAAGLREKPRLTVDQDRYIGYIEAHIEQGDDLEAHGLKIGGVTSIVGIWQYRITFSGVQNHAGTTRMAIRKDAGRTAAYVAVALDQRMPTVAGARSVWTVGNVTLDPGASSIIPGKASMLFQFRDADPAILARMEMELQAIVAEAEAAGPCAVTSECMSRSTPAVMDERFQAALITAAERHAPRLHQRMPSGAGHDAQYLARVMPAAMLFVPSIGGISHHWTEDTAPEDIVLGCQVMATACEALLRE